ncbi:MAG: hypothetical protein ABIQ99_07300 [Thermoflexales bacterium]
MLFHQLPIYPLASNRRKGVGSVCNVSCLFCLSDRTGIGAFREQPLRSIASFARVTKAGDRILSECEGLLLAAVPVVQSPQPGTVRLDKKMKATTIGQFERLGAGLGTPY